jgi:hypothetical protein
MCRPYQHVQPAHSLGAVQQHAKLSCLHTCMLNPLSLHKK